MSSIPTLHETPWVGYVQKALGLDGLPVGTWISVVGRWVLSVEDRTGSENAQSMGLEHVPVPWSVWVHDLSGQYIDHYRPPNR